MEITIQTKKHTFRRHSTDITHTTDYIDNDKPAEIYVDTNYKHYNTTIRRTKKGLQLRTTNSPLKKQKPPLPERKYKEPLRVEQLETISKNKVQTAPLPLIPPPPAYQCLGNNVSFYNPPTTHNAHIPSAPHIQQQQSTSFKTHSYETPMNITQQNRIDILDWTLEIREVSLILNLDNEQISYMGTKLPCDLRKRECHPTPFTKATIVWEPQTHCQLFELIRFDAFMVKYQDRYWIETNVEWTTVQQHDKTQKIKNEQNRHYCHQI